MKRDPNVFHRTFKGYPGDDQQPTLRDVAHEGPPLMRDPDEDDAWMRATLPSGDPEDQVIHDRLYVENPYTTKMPRELRALLNDPTVTGEQRRQVMHAYRLLQSTEGGGRF